MNTADCRPAGLGQGAGLQARTEPADPQQDGTFGLRCGLAPRQTPMLGLCCLFCLFLNTRIFKKPGDFHTERQVSQEAFIGSSLGLLGGIYRK